MNFQQLATVVSVASILAVVPAVRAADDLEIPNGVPVVYGDETVEVGTIRYPQGETGVRAYGTLVLNGTTMTAAGLETPTGSDGAKPVDGYLYVTNGASLSLAAGSKYLYSIYGSTRGGLFLDRSSMSVTGGLTIGTQYYNLNKAPVQTVIDNGSTLTLTGGLGLYGWSDFYVTNSVVNVAGWSGTGRRASTYNVSNIAHPEGITNDFILVESQTSLGSSLMVGQYLPSRVEVRGGSFALAGDLTLAGDGTTTAPHIPWTDVNMTVTDGAALSVTGTVILAHACGLPASLTLSDASFYAGSLRVGEYSLGTVHADGETLTVKDAVAVGYGASATGVVELANGRMTAASLTVGSSGQGALDATNAVLSIDGAVTIGSGATSTGAVEFAAGTLTAASLAVGSSGVGTMNARGAVLTVSGAVTVGANGALDVGDGTLTVGSLTGGEGTSAVELDGCTIRFSADGGLFTGVTTVGGTAKTVTVDTQGHTVTLGNAPSAATPIHFTGGGLVSVASGVSLVNYTFDRSVHFAWADKGATTTISQPEAGTYVADTQDRAFAGNATLRFDITSGATRVASGVLGNGALEKVGGGYLKLTNPADYLANVLVGGGTLALGSEMLADTLSALSVTNAANELVVIENDGRLVGNFPSKENFKGSFLKRGAGELVWERSAGSATYAMSSPLLTQEQFNPHEPLDFTDPSVLPTNNYAVINVAEGRLVLRGTSAARNSFTVNGQIAVGVPTTPCRAQPELVLDHVSISQSTYSYFQLGSGIGAESPEVVAPKLVLNDTDLSSHSFKVAELWPTYNGAKWPIVTPNKNLRTTAFFTNSLMYLSWAFSPNGGYNSGSEYVFTKFFFRDSEIRLSQIIQKNSHLLEFDHSVFRSNASKAADYCNWGYYYYGDTTNTYVFANGSKFYYGGTITSLACDKVASRQTRVFDDSEWIFSNAAGDVSYEINPNVNFYAVMRGKGLVLMPDAGETYTMTEALHGDGGFVNGGAGTVVLTNGVVRYAGVTAVTNAAGAVDFDGATVSAAKVAGPGTFRNGTLASPTVALTSNADGTKTDAPLLDFSNALALTGTVTVDLGSSVLERPLEGNLTLTVATYTGSTPPDLTGWSLKKNAQVRKGTFAAAAGKVTCIPEFRRGFVLMLR